MGRKYTVFTYGSLMRGFYGYEQFMQTAEFLGEATVNGDLRFFCSDYPVLIRKGKGGKPVKGELFRVDESTMADLRRYEGLKDPFTCYTERVVKAQTEKGEVAARAFVVIPQIEIPMMFASRNIPESDWRKFVSRGKRFPVPKPLVLFFGGCILGAAVWEIVFEMGLI